MTHRVVSPLKKVKRKADYGQEDSEEEEDGPTEPPQKALRRLTITEGSFQDRTLS